VGVVCAGWLYGDPACHPEDVRDTAVSFTEPRFGPKWAGKMRPRLSFTGPRLDPKVKNAAASFKESPGGAKGGRERRSRIFHKAPEGPRVRGDAKDAAASLTEPWKGPHLSQSPGEAPGRH